MRPVFLFLLHSSFSRQLKHRSYDSEEDRLQARLHNTARHRTIHNERKRQENLLREYRERQHTLGHVKEAARLENIRCATNQPLENGLPGASSVPEGGHFLLQTLNKNEFQLLQHHEELWLSLERKKTSVREGADIPWPPFAADYTKYLLGMALLLEPKDIKKAYTKAALRWHPDKWMTKVLDENTLKRIEEIAKGLNAAYDSVSSSSELT